MLWLANMDATLSRRFQDVLKRTFDVIVCSLTLLIALPLWALVAIALTLDSYGPVFYRGLRVGRYGSLFRVYKFRTMTVNADQDGVGVTGKNDPGITWIGRRLRKTKLDEMPQILNVLRGEMSIIGPRPEDPRYVAEYTPEQRRILTVRPGLVGPAYIRYRHEEELLARSPDPERTYLETILPDKTRMDLEYIDHRSFFYEVRIMARGLAALFDYRTPRGLKNETNDARDSEGRKNTMN